MTPRQILMSQGDYMRKRMYSQCTPVATQETHAVGDYVRVVEDLDIPTEDVNIFVPEGTTARITNLTNEQVSLDFGPEVGGASVDRVTFNRHFGAYAQSPSESIRKSMLEATFSAQDIYPGRIVQITSYDSTIGPNRGPKSPGHGGYATLVGQEGRIVTQWLNINGIRTFKVQLTRGGEFVFGETEFTVLA